MMGQKRFPLGRVFISILLCWWMVMPVAMARSWVDIKRSGIIRVAVEGMTPAFNFFDNGKLAGLEVDMAEEMAKRLGLKIEWVVQPFNTLLIGLTQDRFDLIAASHIITPERSKAVDFITPHYCTDAQIFSKPGGPHTVAELKDKVVVAGVGTVYADKAAGIPNLKQLLTVPNETDALMALLNGRADAWVTESVIAEAAFKALPQKTEFQRGETILRLVNAMAVSKGNAELQKIFSEQMQAMLNDGTYDKITHTYLEEELRCK